MPYTYNHPRPAVTADCVVLATRDAELEVLLIERGGEPFAGCWALPGGFVEIDEDLEAAARRELAEETGLAVAHMDQIGAFGAPARDPRGRVISVAFLAMVPAELAQVRAGSDAKRVEWRRVSALPPLAFDHAEILAAGLAAFQAGSRSGSSR